MVDSEPGGLEAFRTIFQPGPVTLRVVSSRSSSEPGPAQRIQSEIPAEYARSLKDALPRLAEGRFAGVFCRWGQGFELDQLKAAREVDPELRFVLVTGDPDATIAAVEPVFGEAGARMWDVLRLPLSPLEAQVRARQCLLGRRLARERFAEKKRLESQLQHQVKSERFSAIGTLSRGVIHEFSGLMTRITGKAEIGLGEKTVEQTHAAFEGILKAAERGTVILQNLKSLVRLDTARENIDLRTPLREALELLDHEVKLANVKVTQDQKPGLPQVNVSRVEMTQVFLNLILNAVHAMPDGGHLAIRLAPDQGGIAVEFEDDGVGIPVENLERIFEPLFTTKGERGTGIGLSVCRGIVLGHQGRLTVESRPARGTCFRIWLPAL